MEDSSTICGTQTTSGSWMCSLGLLTVAGSALPMAGTKRHMSHHATACNIQQPKNIIEYFVEAHNVQMMKHERIVLQKHPETRPFGAILAPTYNIKHNPFAMLGTVYYCYFTFWVRHGARDAVSITACAPHACSHPAYSNPSHPPQSLGMMSLRWVCSQNLWDHHIEGFLQCRAAQGAHGVCKCANTGL